jgi:hypothetical protein
MKQLCFHKDTKAKGQNEFRKAVQLILYSISEAKTSAAPTKHSCKHLPRDDSNARYWQKTWGHGIKASYHSLNMLDHFF